MALLYGRAGRLTAENGGFRPGQVEAEIPSIAGNDNGFYLTVRARPGRLSALSVSQRFSMKIHVVWGFLYGRAGRLTSLFGGFRPGQVEGETHIVGLDGSGSTLFAEGGTWSSSETDAKLAQKLGQLQLFIAVSPQECMGQLASSGPT
jgi:hypothetical protein